MIAVKRFISGVIFIALMALCSSEPSLAGTNSWVSVRSENFLVLGHTGADEVRLIATQLEEFRAVFSQLLTKDHFDSSIPTIVIVFASDEAYRPFKPLYQGQPDQFVTGYLQSGPEVNYITLASAPQRGDTASILFHEYVHILTRNKYGPTPLWFKEGMAEYYSAYDLPSGGVRVRVGKRLPRRVHHLRTRQLLPLPLLLTTDSYSPLYNEHDTRGIFYAQSWALVHYLLSDRSGERQRQLPRFLELVAGGASIEDGIGQAFGTEPAAFEDRVRAYIRLAQYSEHIKLLDQQPTVPPVGPAVALTEAETQTYLGDLLLRIGRHDEAHNYLHRALTLDPRLAAAHTSLGILHLRENRIAEAKEHLRSAIAADPQSYLAHYHFADLLRREGSESENTVAGYAERTSLIRSRLKKVIELAPGFLDAYAQLILVDIERSPQLDEAAELLKGAMARAPRRHDFKLLLARMHLRKQQFDAARALLNMLAHDRSADPVIKAEARTALNASVITEKIAADRRKLSEGMPEQATATASAADRRPALPCDMPEPGPQLKPARFAGQQVCGRLVRIECGEAGILLFVEAGERMLKLYGAALNRVRFITYTSKVRGRIECGPLVSAQPVLVTYRPAPADERAIDGELTAVEFVPEDWLH